MKTKLNLLAALMFICLVSNAQNASSHKASADHTLNHLKYAVNNRNFSVISPYLADDYEYEGMKPPMSVNILKQVIAQFPRIDSIVVIKTEKKEHEIYLDLKFYNANGPSEKKIVLDSNFNILQADIATISLQGHGSSQKPSAQDEHRNISTSWLEKTIPFWLTETGHIVVEAEVNGIKGNYIVDSGTQGNLLLNSGYASYETKKLSNMPKGVSGKIKDAGEVIIKRFKWSGIEIENLKAMAADLDHLGKNMKVSSFAGTIGYGILKDFIIEFDYAQDQLVVWQNASSIKERYGIKTSQIVPLSMAFHIPVLKAQIGHKEIRLGLDCGAQGNMLEEEWKDILNNNYTNLRNEKLVGAENNYVDALKVSMKNLRINERSYEMDFVFGKLFGGDHKITMLDGLLGYSFLSYQKTAINFKDNELYFLR